jgi:hypothetical protein
MRLTHENISGSERRLHGVEFTRILACHICYIFPNLFGKDKVEVVCIGLRGDMRCLKLHHGPGRCPERFFSCIDLQQQEKAGNEYPKDYGESIFVHLPRNFKNTHRLG